MKTFKKIVTMFILVVLMFADVPFADTQALADTAALSQAHFPTTGKKTKSDGSLTIDYSHIDQGYVMVKAKKSEKRMQVMVYHGSDSMHYEINGKGEFEVIPLQMGNGTYKFTLGLAQSKGSNRYKCAGTISLKCTMKDETSCFLYPNQYVDYDADDPFVAKASELCEGLSDPMKIAKKICKCVENHFAYDWSKASTIKGTNAKNLLPNISTTWKTKKGVCQDLSALICAMLRSQGVPAKLAIGHADGNYHAWVVVLINGKAKRYDPTASCSRYKAERYY